MTLQTITRPVSLTDTKWDLLRGQLSPADRPSEGEVPDYSAALSRLLSGLSGGPMAIPQETQREPLTVDAGERVVAHTDGSCSGNPGPGGWAPIVEVVGNGSGPLQEVELSDGAARTTNNQMELTAAIRVLEATLVGAVVEVVTDSQYVAKGATDWMPGWVRRSWKTGEGKSPENVALWKQLKALTDSREVTFRWTKGHAGDPRNERADALAQEMAARYGAEV